MNSDGRAFVVVRWIYLSDSDYKVSLPSGSVFSKVRSCCPDRGGVRNLDSARVMYCGGLKYLLVNHRLCANKDRVLRGLSAAARPISGSVRLMADR